ncbi:hypothetical protein [Methanobrevibacter sp.]|uniref:hypothetical protein n=1 Tax=Methanobrevibacter sp. TaxID=66852 RepID=UPI0038669E45
MVKQITNKAFMQMCKDIKKHVEENYELPVKLVYDGVTYYQLEMQFAMAWGLQHVNSSGFTIPNFGKAASPKGDAINADVMFDEIRAQCNRVYNHIKKYGNVPDSVLCYDRNRKQYFISIKVWTYALAKTVVYYPVNRQFPLYTHYSSSSFVKPTPKKSYSEEIFDLFCKYFGKPDSIDDALRRIRWKGYGFYYDDHLTNVQTIEGLAGKGPKPNCTDVHQMMWHVGKVLDYDVRAKHVWCTKSNVGHVRLDFNRGNGWFSRDAAAVIDGECVECIWCENGEFLAYNPSWFLSNLNR